MAKPFFFERVSWIITYDDRLVYKSKPPALKVVKVAKGDQKPMNNVQGCAILLVIGVLVLMVIGYCSDSKKVVVSQIDLESNEMKQNAFFYSKYYVEDRLKSPATAEFSHTEYSCSVILADSTYYVTSYVDAQNSFGALIRNNFVAVMKYKGGDPNVGTNWEFNSMEFIPGD